MIIDENSKLGMTMTYVVYAVIWQLFSSVQTVVSMVL